MSVNYTAKRGAQGCCRCDGLRVQIVGCRTGGNKVAYACRLQAVCAGGGTDGDQRGGVLDMVGAGVRAGGRRAVHGHVLPAGGGRGVRDRRHRRMAGRIDARAAADRRRVGGAGDQPPRIGGASGTRRRHRKPALDVGQEVQVLAWNDNGTARVNYRGTQWDAAVASPADSARRPCTSSTRAARRWSSRPAGPEHDRARRHGKANS